VTVFGVFFTILVVAAILSICGEIVMRIRLSRLEVPAEKLLWWRRGGDEVADTYQELFPRSRLPVFRRFIFWLFIAATAVVLLTILRKSP
jgi:hypothetical protein